MGLKQKTMKARGQRSSTGRAASAAGRRAGSWRTGDRTAKRNVWAVGLLDVQPDDRVLEIGFGPGIAIEEMARRATRGLVVGVDHSEVMVRQATRRNAAAVRDGTRRPAPRLGRGRCPQFDAPFDKILAVNSLMFWDDPVDAAEGAAWSPAPRRTDRDRLPAPRPGIDGRDLARAGQEIAAHFATAGFTDVRVETLALKPTAVVCVLGVSPGP